jgi:hypothetical protein
MCGEGEERGSARRRKRFPSNLPVFGVHPLAAAIAQYLVFFFLDSFLMSFFFFVFGFRKSFVAR